MESTKMVKKKQEIRKSNGGVYLIKVKAMHAWKYNETLFYN
jgi:hypothetical protein